MNKEEALDKMDKVFWGMNALAIQLGKINGRNHKDFTPVKLPKEIEELRQYIKENLK